MNGSSTAPQLLRAAIASYESVLTTKGRKRLDKSDFALPGGRYPIHDLAHARNALARVAQNGTPEEQKKVRAAVYRKYPGLKKRAQESERPVRVLESVQGKPGEGPRVKVVLVDEGLGNRRNMNYYGPEAIASAVKVFEGKPCHLNHPSDDAEKNLPEGSVVDQVGYYKNLRVEKLPCPETGKLVDACVGELHFDLSEAGATGYAKALTAMHYQREFPGSRQQYVGWSVLGDGRAEQREMEVDGKPTKVNYVMEFLEGERCDIVTRAGRGGRILDVMVAESATGQQEDGMKNLKKTLARLREAAEKATGEEQKRLTAAADSLAAALKEAEEEKESEADESEALFQKKEDESDADHMDRLHGYAKMLAKHLGSKEEEAEDAADGDPEPDADDEPAKESALSPAELRRNKKAVLSLISEAGIPKGAYSEAKVERLARMPFQRAERVIAEEAKFAAAIADRIEQPVASLRGGKVRESADTSAQGIFAAAYNSTRKEA